MPRYQVNMQIRAYLDADDGYAAERILDRITRVHHEEAEDAYVEWEVHDLWSDLADDQDHDDEEEDDEYAFPEDDYNT